MQGGPEEAPWLAALTAGWQWISPDPCSAPSAGGEMGELLIEAKGAAVGGAAASQVRLDAVALSQPLSAEEVLLDVIDAIMLATNRNIQEDPALASLSESGSISEIRPCTTLRELLDAGLLPALMAYIKAPPLALGRESDAKEVMQDRCLALEALCCLLSPEVGDCGISESSGSNCAIHSTFHSYSHSYS